MLLKIRLDKPVWAIKKAAGVGHFF